MFVRKVYLFAANAIKGIPKKAAESLVCERRAGAVPDAGIRNEQSVRGIVGCSDWLCFRKHAF